MQCMALKRAIHVTDKQCDIGLAVFYVTYILR